MVDVPGRPRFSSYSRGGEIQTAPVRIRYEQFSNKSPPFFVDMMYGTWAISVKIFLHMPSLDHKSKSKSSAGFE